MKSWAPEDIDPEFEMTPMIDVVFLLIAFFMTLISFVSAELIKLELPEAAEATVPEEPGDRQYVSIDKDGKPHLGSREITFPALAGELARLKAKNPSLQLYLRADANTMHRYVNKAMAACAKAKIFDIIFANQKD